MTAYKTLDELEPFTPPGWTFDQWFARPTLSSRIIGTREVILGSKRFYQLMNAAESMEVIPLKLRGHIYDEYGRSKFWWIKGYFRVEFPKIGILAWEDYATATFRVELMLGRECQANDAAIGYLSGDQGSNVYGDRGRSGTKSYLQSRLSGSRTRQGW